MKTGPVKFRFMFILVMNVLTVGGHSFAQRPVGGDLYERNADDYENLAWVANIARMEGPATDRDGNLYFTEIATSRIMKLSSDDELST